MMLSKKLQAGPKSRSASEQTNPVYFLPGGPDDTGNVQSVSLAVTLAREMRRRKKGSDTLIVLCIGTDKITGDCLGPLVGTKLKERDFPHPVYGTLEHPVHALNLSHTLSSFQKMYRHPFILAVDAAVGPADAVGCVSLSPSPIRPGQGVLRPLPPVGNLSLTGIVAEASATSDWDLPYTRLFVVERMAEFICRAVMKCEELTAR